MQTSHSGKSILALHGFTGCGADFDCLRDGSMQTHWVTPDLHGVDAPKAFPDLIQWLVAHFENLATNAPRVLLGYSMGGRIALHLAWILLREKRFRPQDRLILISASPGLKNEAERCTRRAQDSALADKILAAPSAEDFYAFWKTIPLIASQDSMPEPWRSRLLNSRKLADKTRWAQALKDFGTGTLPSLWEKLEDLDIETLLIYGENDAKFSAIAREMHAVLPRSRLCEIPHCAHAPHLESPDGVSRLLAHWMTESLAKIFMR